VSLCSIVVLYMLQFVVAFCVCDGEYVHAVDEVIICGVLLFLWVTRDVVYNQICGCEFYKYVECQCVM
jgi:hypothetical protein